MFIELLLHASPELSAHSNLFGGGIIHILRVKNLISLLKLFLTPFLYLQVDHSEMELFLSPPSYHPEAQIILL